MGIPKRRHSKQRGRTRRAHIKLTKPDAGVCSHCGQPKLAHHVCGNCGYYGEKQIVEKKA